MCRSRKGYPAGALVTAFFLILGACGSTEADGDIETAPASAAPTTTSTGSTTATSDEAADGARLPAPLAETSGDSSSTTSSASTETTVDSSASTTPTTTAITRPPGANPNCSVSCNIVMEGDSLTLGLGDWLCLQVATGACINSGIGGNRVDHMIETARNDVDIHLGSGDNDVLILWAGTNDMWQQHHSADPVANVEAAYGFISSYVSERRSKGWDVVFILTNPPANPDLIKGSDHLNDLIRANTAGADAIIDVGAEPKLANPFDAFLRAPDGVHYKDPGREIVVYEHLVPAIRSLDGR